MHWVKKHKAEITNSSLSMDGTILSSSRSFPNRDKECALDYDPHLDTPVELLHTILLGIVKYVWHSTHTSWKDKGFERPTYALRLQATDVSGLSIPAIRANYILNYANSLIGRQLKTVVQTFAFHRYDLVPAPLYDLVKAVGELTALLWTVSISDMDQYTVRTPVVFMSQWYIDSRGHLTG